jgi:hypothetical protein
MDGLSIFREDMQKAYDHVEWDYLEGMMAKLGFHTAWVQMVMRMVTTVSFSVLLNGEHLEEFKLSTVIHLRFRYI